MPSSRFLLAASSSSPRLRFASASVPLHFPMPSPCRCPCFPASSPLSSPHLFPPRFPMPSYSSSPASSSHFSPLPPYLPCVLLLFAAPAPPCIFPLRFSMPSPCRLYIYPCVLSSSLSHALREKSLCYDSGFSSDRDSFCLVSGKGASLRCVLFSCGRQGGCLLCWVLNLYIYRCKCDFLQKMCFFDEKNREMLADSKKVPTFASAFEK